jgi:hypothetical protein
VLAPVREHIVLALGICAAVAIFGFVDAALIRPLPTDVPRFFKLGSGRYRNQFLPREGMFAASTTSTLLLLSRATPTIISSKGVFPGFWNECHSLSWIGIVSPVRIGAVSAPWLEKVTAPSPLMT